MTRCPVVPGGDGGLDYQHPEPVIPDGRQGLADGVKQAAELRLPVLTAGGAHAVVNKVTVPDCGLPIVGGEKAPVQMALQRRVQSRLQKGQPSGADQGQPLRVCLNRVHPVTVLGKAQGGGQPHKAKADNGYHTSSPSSHSLMYSRKYRTPCWVVTWGR